MMPPIPINFQRRLSNQIVHGSNDRLMHDVEMCVKHEVPVVITSLGARPEVFDAIHSYGGICLHDVINNRFAKRLKKAPTVLSVLPQEPEDAGTLSPMAFIQEVREWFDGPILLSGAIGTGDAVLAAQAMGADLAYLGSAFIATEANAVGYKQGIVDNGSSDMVYANLFTGVHGRYIRPSIEAAGLDPDGYHRATLLI